MAEHVNILPPNATSYERSLHQAADPMAELGDDYGALVVAQRVWPEQFGPWIIWQFGLGELEPYVPNLQSLIDEGIGWQRVRGTPKAHDMAVAWLGYGGDYEFEAPYRVKWNTYHWHLDRVRDAVFPDLLRLNGVIQLSAPLRSIFIRGFHGYDQRACIAGGSRLSGALLENHSGVRVESDGALWSFGRDHVVDHALSETELDALGTWIEPVPEGGTWAEADFTWAEATFPWTQPAAQSRRTTIANALADRDWHVRFYDADGAVIGARRAVLHPVRPVIARGL